MKKPVEAGFFASFSGRQTAFQNTPKSISNKMTVMGTPSNQAMMGMLISFEVGLSGLQPQVKRNRLRCLPACKTDARKKSPKTV